MRLLSCSIIMNSDTDTQSWPACLRFTPAPLRAPRRTVLLPQLQPPFQQCWAPEQTSQWKCSRWPVKREHLRACKLSFILSGAIDPHNYVQDILTGIYNWSGIWRRKKIFFSGVMNSSSIPEIRKTAFLLNLKPLCYLKKEIFCIPTCSYNPRINCSCSLTDNLFASGLH